MSLIAYATPDQLVAWAAAQMLRSSSLMTMVPC